MITENIAVNEALGSATSNDETMETVYEELLDLICGYINFKADYYVEHHKEPIIQL